MDTSSVPLHNFGLQFQWCSDSDISGMSSPDTLSPVTSMDSSLSPSYQQLPESTPPKATRTVKSSTCSLSRRGRRAGKPARVRSKQRESASEKEKLRMRDLTKALHHLRSYLPPSVAPAGQNLTKIETLRLTIRYISHLSAQLGLNEEALFQRREQRHTSATDSSSPDILAYFQHSSAIGQEVQLQHQNQGLDQPLYSSQCPSQNTAFHSGTYRFGVNQYTVAPPEDVSVDAILHTPPATQPSCQVNVRSVRFYNERCLPLQNKSLLTTLSGFSLYRCAAQTSACR